MDRARAGEPSGLWVVAGEQTQGRGRQGRPWSSPRGNLHASVLLRNPCTQRFAPQLGFVAGVSLLQALRAAAPAAPVALKWPNDVLCGAAKLAGVLVEGATLPGGDFACVIGFGVNCVAGARRACRIARRALPTWACAARPSELLRRACRRTGAQSGTVARRRGFPGNSNRVAGRRVRAWRADRGPHTQGRHARRLRNDRRARTVGPFDPIRAHRQ